MTFGTYALGVAATLAFIAAVAFSDYRLRQRFLPGWSGSRRPQS